MKKILCFFIWILTWRAEWTSMVPCPDVYDEVRGEYLKKEKAFCYKRFYNWRSKSFATIEELNEFREDRLRRNRATVVSDVSWFEVKER